MVPTPLIKPFAAALPHDSASDDHLDDPVEELAHVRPATAHERDPSRRARRASEEAGAYLSARRRRLRRRLEESDG